MDCGISRPLVRARVAHTRTLARINPKHHTAQEQRNVGRAHLVDKALRVLGTGELLLKVRKAKTGVDALAQDTAQMLLALHDGHARKRGRHAGRSAADNDHVERLRLHRLGSSGIRASVAHIKRRHPSAPPSAVPLPARIWHLPTALRWGRSPACGQGSPPRGSDKIRSGTDLCRRGSGA